jgi:hypothetical protein
MSIFALVSVSLHRQMWRCGLDVRWWVMLVSGRLAAAVGQSDAGLVHPVGQAAIKSEQNDAQQRVVDREGRLHH